MYRTPTICVGNLSTGGTGKTPMVEYLINLLRPYHTVAVLSRGYRRKSKGFVLAEPDTKVTDLGDEPYQIYAKFPEVFMAVDADRQHGITILEETKQPDCILLDDAFQHRKVRAGLNILLTAYGKLYSDDWYLPTGNLRDAKGAAKRAHIIVVTKCPKNMDKKAQEAIITALRPNKNQHVLFSYLQYNSAFVHRGNNVPLDYFKDKKITVVTGIADPLPFLGHIGSLGIPFEHLRFKDHHFFSPQDIELLKTKDTIITTEKDYVRLKGKLDTLYYMPVRHRFLEPDAALMKNLIMTFMTRDS